MHAAAADAIKCVSTEKNTTFLEKKTAIMTKHSKHSSSMPQIAIPLHHAFNMMCLSFLYFMMTEC
jgi:hypothetical protein